MINKVSIMTDFEWNESHVEWFVKTFGNSKKEIFGRCVEKRYRPKNGEPKKGRPIGNEKTITMDDFRMLMRLMVVKGKARVVCSYSGSSKYSIRMVSEEYPYKVELFDRHIFNHPVMIASMPTPEDLFCIYRVPPNYLETDSNKSDYILVSWYGMAYMVAFAAYNFKGGDFDCVFDWVSVNISPDFFYDKCQKELFIFETNIFIALYKVCKAGKVELMMDVINNPAQTIGRNDPIDIPIENFTPTVIGDYNNFLKSFRSDLIKDFMVLVDKQHWPKRSIKDETYYKTYRWLVRSVETNSHIDPRWMTTLEPGQYSKETQYRLDNCLGEDSISILRKSEDNDILKAIRELTQAVSNRENFKLASNSKKGDVG
jgi:hypothetical protein